MITNFTTLVASLDGSAGWLHRTDLTSRIPEFIQLAEADMQVRCKLVEFESTATVAITAGVGTLPTDLVGVRSVYWDDDFDRPLDYVTPDLFNTYRNATGDTFYYTVSGTTIRTTAPEDGSVVLTYNARFAPITASNLTNSLITNYPDVYLHGAIYQAAVFLENDEKAKKHLALFEAAVARVVTNNEDRKFAGSIQVKAA